MAEGSETPGGQSGAGSPGRGPGEGDLLAERRARRAAESGEGAIVRRAEAAEATVRTLETHVASLQARLHGAEEERRRMSELIEAEKAAAADRSLTEQELRRAKQHEYAEQRLRVEAEDRRTDAEREGRIEIDRLTRRLGASEQRARELSRQLERAQRRLAEAEQMAATDVAAARRGEGALQARLTDLEQRALEIQHGLQAERAARERSDRLLESMREGHRRVEAIVGELGAAIGRLRAAAAQPEESTPAEPASAGSRPEGPAPLPGGAPLPGAAPQQEKVPPNEPLPSQEPVMHRLSELPRPAAPTAAAAAPRAAASPEETERGEMADALAAAVERLRARVQEAETGAVSAGSEPAIGEAAGPEPGAAQPAGASAAPRAKAPAHKHSMSWLTRFRIRRKERRERRSAKAEAPSMKRQ